MSQGYTAPKTQDAEDSILIQWLGRRELRLGLQAYPRQGSYLHTIVTDTTVGTPRRTVEAAGGAPLHAHLDALNLHGFVKGRAEVIFLVFILLSCTEEKSIKKQRCQHRTRHEGCTAI